MSSTLSLVAGLIYVGIMLCKWFLASLYVRRVGFEACEADVFPDAPFYIVQPILSGDCELEANLRTNLAQLPSQVQFLWMIDREDLVGRQIAERIDHDERALSNGTKRIEIIECDRAASDINPKAFKLQLAFECIQRKQPVHEVVTDAYFVVLDDDTTIKKESLDAAVRSLEQYDLYTGLPRYRRGGNVWSNLVAQFVNSNAVMTYLPPLCFFEPLSINGMFYVTKFTTLTDLGGFHAILRTLCDDYAVKCLFERGGKKLHQGITYQTLSTTVPGPWDYLRLMHRWTLFALILAQQQAWRAKLFLVVFLGAPSLLFLVCCLAACCDLRSLVGFVLLLIIRYGLIRSAQLMTRNHDLKTHFIQSTAAEVLQPIHLLSAMMYRKIRWRSRWIRVNHDQHFEILEPQRAAAN